VNREKGLENKAVGRKSAGNPPPRAADPQRMLSVIIATLDSERPLVPTLAALVPGATSALVSEVVLADGGSRDETAMVADIAGCTFLRVEGSLGRRLKTGAEAARAPWLLFLRPGIVLDARWIAEVRGFVGQSPPSDRAAVFRRAASAHAGRRDALALFLAALGAAPRPEQGLIIRSDFYRQLGGHADASADPEADFIRRIGRRRIITLSTAAFPAPRSNA
jgi:glycosyltransferase involved in cell wall biosynthesis